jgi:alpha-beta hydrolase superfamily lysophospholipase
MRPTAETMPKEEWWQWNGLDVHLDRARVPGSRLKVLVLHGAGAYGRVMAPCAVLAQKYGFDTVAPDLPGYGLTRVPWARFDYDAWVSCVVDLIDHELAKDDKPIALFGVSLGGILAYQAAARSRRVAGICVTTLADTREHEVRRDFARTKLLGTLGVSLLSSVPALTDFLPLPMAYMSKMHNISQNAALSRICMTDRLGGGNIVPARFLRTFMNAAPAIEPEAFRDCPVLLAHPGEDRMTDITHSQRFYDRLACEKSMVILPGASHMPIEPSGARVLEAEAIQFFQRLAERSAPQRPSERPQGAARARQSSISGEPLGCTSV